MVGGVHQPMRAERKRWRQSHPLLGYTQLDILVRESTAHRLVPGAESFLEDRGLSCSSVKQSFQQLVRLQNKAQEDKFRSEHVKRLW